MMRLVSLQDTPATPWRNGGGTTQELLVWPTGRDWQCRISVARIDRSGPFSAFAGVQRWFTVLQGSGVRLTLNPLPVVLTPDSEPLCFDGAAAPGCDLLAGPTLDLNLMAQVQAGNGHMVRAQSGVPWRSPAALRAVFTLDEASLFVQGGELQTLPAGTLAFDDGGARQAWLLGGQSRPLRAWWLSFTVHAP